MPEGYRGGCGTPPAATTRLGRDERRRLARGASLQRGHGHRRRGRPGPRDLPQRRVRRRRVRATAARPPRQRRVRSWSGTRSTWARARPCRPGSSTRSPGPTMQLGRHLRRRRPAPDLATCWRCSSKARAEDLDGRLRVALPRRPHRRRRAQEARPADGRRLHQPDHPHPAHRRPQRAAAHLARRRRAARDHPEPDGARLRAGRSRSARSTSATPRARCTSSTPTTPGPRASRSGTPSTSWPS